MKDKGGLSLGDRENKWRHGPCMTYESLTNKLLVFVVTTFRLL